MQKNDILEINISSLSYDGQGICRNKNYTIFVPRTMPGDMAQVKIISQRENFAHGELIKIIKPSEKRVKSGCNAFETGCGGCQWLHMDYREQLVWKKKLLEDALKFQGKITVQAGDVIGMLEPSHSRNKLSLLNKKGKLLFIQENSSRTIFLQDCPQEIAGNMKVYNMLKKMTLPDEILQVHIRGTQNGSSGICFFVKRMTPDVRRISSRIIKGIGGIAGIGASSYREYYPLAGRDYIEEKIGNINYRIPLNGFFQTNYTQAGVLQKLVVDAVADGTENVLDLYCGSGFFTLPAALKVSHALGVENNPDAIRNAVANAKINHLDNAEFIVADVRRFVTGIKPGKFQAVILDPPRMGCGPEVMKEMVRLKPKRLIYISCSPEALARELRVFADTGYKITLCQPVDMFPQTFHVETVVVMDLNN